MGIRIRPSKGGNKTQHWDGQAGSQAWAEARQGPGSAGLWGAGDQPCYGVTAARADVRRGFLDRARRAPGREQVVDSKGQQCLAKQAALLPPDKDH